ncbi:MAG: hypothetical protein JSW70_08740 [Syntrophobacterales bacterium]|nr:MAG: hypothetical protein JSW70_08740 [Syntrophobacterales bacterium]
MQRRKHEEKEPQSELLHGSILAEGNEIHKKENGGAITGPVFYKRGKVIVRFHSLRIFPLLVFPPILSMMVS